ncbi:MAG: hypothetical protein DI582_07465 [Azospirillum brasilense]|nr:MAG: hypothetical protein DI582_07465 [Azospirillum brasilense]
MQAARALRALATILHDDMAMRFVAQSGSDMPIEYGRIAAQLGLLPITSTAHDVHAALAPIGDNLRHLKARLAIQLEPSLLSNSTPAQRERALHVIGAIDQIGELAQLDVQLTPDQGGKGAHAQEAFRAR